MPQITSLREIDALCQLLKSIESGVAVSIANCLEGGTAEVNTWQRFVGWSAPPEDCCPSIAVWGDNLRPQASVFGNRCPLTWLFDVTVRVSECFVDMDETGNGRHPIELEEDACRLYALMHCAYFGFICQWQSGNIDEIDACDNVEFGPVRTYAEGGCGGVEYTLTFTLTA
jgi:hypothetical protein